MIRTTRGRLTAVLMLAVSLLSLYAALAGIFDGNIYGEVLAAGTIPQFLAAGSVAQDIIAIPAALVLAVLSVLFLARPGRRVFIAILGLAGFFFYGYGLYAIQGQYTSLYLVYLAIFGLSLYGLIAGLTSFDAAAVRGLRLPPALRVVIALFLLLIPLVLMPVWLARMAADIARRAPGDTYGVFVLDLCVVFPALAATAVMLLRNAPFGNVLAGVALMKVLTVCLSVTFGEWFTTSPAGRAPDYGMIGLFGILTAFSSAAGALYLRDLKSEVTK